MLWIKRNLSLAVGVGIALVLMVLAGWYLFQGIQKNREMGGKLEAAKSEFETLWRSKVFPNEENIKAAEDEIARLKKLKTDLAKYFQPIPYEKGWDTVRFSTEVQRMADHLYSIAEDKNIQLRPDFPFSFSVAVFSVLEDRKSVDVLASQMSEVKALCELLFKSGITGLDFVKRAKVSKDDEGTKAAPEDYLVTQASAITNDLGIVMPYKITFQAFSSGLANVLHNFKTAPYGFVIKSIEIGTGGPSGGGSFGALPPAQMDRIASIIENYQPGLMAQRQSRRMQRGAPGFNPGGPRPSFPSTDQSQAGGLILPGSQPPNSNPNAPKPHLDEVPVTISLMVHVVRLK